MWVSRRIRTQLILLIKPVYSDSHKPTENVITINHNKITSFQLFSHQSKMQFK